MDIKQLTDFSSLASFLGIKTGYLSKIINNISDKSYKEFQIPKKNGGYRVIYTPNSELLYMQKKISELLSNSFHPYKRSYAFTKNRSIIDNARLHLNKNFVLNLDIKNFFPSISFIRVRFMFINYFKLNKNISTVLAKICCHPGNDTTASFLPQGGAASPVISNIICKTLDKDLVKLCSNFKGITYSRYADDITLSSNHKFSKKLIFFENGEINLGEDMLKIFKNNYFEVNYKKLRLQTKHEKQVVTGIKVNEKLNLNRTYIREIRSILWSLEINVDVPQNVIDKFKNSPFSNKLSGIDGVFSFLKGRIDFLGHVRGFSDDIYIKFVVQFNSLVDIYEVNQGFKIKKILAKKQNVFVIPETKVSYYSKKVDEVVSIDYGQGTAFMLKDVGIISNYHVFEFLINSVLEGDMDKSYLKKIVFFDYRSPEIKRYASIKKYSRVHDLVVLELNDFQFYEPMGFDSTHNYSENQNIKLLGHPRYTVNDSIRKVLGVINRENVMKEDGTFRFEVSCHIISGNSGGPVLNTKNQVLGVASQGNGSYPNLVIPIHFINSLESIE